MNPGLKNFLIICAKHAVAAILTNSALMLMFSDTFTLHTKLGVIALLKATAAIVGGAEAKVWIPKALKWATSNDDLPPGPPASKAA
jgi:hypothetical protein